jgi:organic hydroperoxide reductase OsmC/OhrA
MAEHNVTVTWQRSTPDFDYKTFDRTHTWRFSGGQIVKGSAAPAYYGNPELASPEAGLVAVLSSCQMLTFLAIAALKRFVVDSYEDHAEGTLGKNARGKTMVSQIVLRPKVVFGAESVPDSDTLQSMHHKAKYNCFIANSLLTEVILEPR